MIYKKHTFCCTKKVLWMSKQKNIYYKNKNQFITFKHYFKYQNNYKITIGK